MKRPNRLIRMLAALSILAGMLVFITPAAVASPSPGGEEAIWDGESWPPLFGGTESDVADALCGEFADLCDGAQEVYFAAVGNGDDFGLGAAQTSITIQNIDVDDAYVFFYVGNGDGWDVTEYAYLAAGPNRRAEFYNSNSDTAFMAEWTTLVHSQDIDAVVEAARGVALGGNVFLGGHSAGTGFTARYAATDFNLTGTGAPEPGYAKLRGLVLLEGGGASTSATPLSADTLDRIEAKFDGGLFGAVRDNAPRCVDGITACTIANEATDCVGQVPPKCTLPTTSYHARKESGSGTASFSN